MEEKTGLPCEEKLTFDNKKEAEASVVSLNWQRGAKLKAYKCQHCELWHLTSRYKNE